jgi:hypothetical protein
VAVVGVAVEVGARATPPPRRGYTRVHRVIGKRQVVFKAATAASLRRGRRIIVKNQVHCTPPSAQARLHRFGTPDGDVES